MLDSVSRVEPAITTPERRAPGPRLRKLLAAGRDAKDLIEIGAYVAGTNPVVDRAVASKPAIDAFLRQPVTEVSDLDAALSGLLALPPPTRTGAMRAFRFRLESVARVRELQEGPQRNASRWRHATYASGAVPVRTAPRRDPAAGLSRGPRPTWRRSCGSTTSPPAWPS